MSRQRPGMSPRFGIAFAAPAGGHLAHGFSSPDVAFLLINIAFLALIVWAFHPGLHPALLVGVACLGISLAILHGLPVRPIGLGLLFLAALLMVVDLKAKAHGALTAAGVVAFVFGGAILFRRAAPQARVSAWLLYSVPIALGVVTLGLIRALESVRNEPLHAGVGALVGTAGVAETLLNPAGRVHVHGESWSALSVGGTVAAGSPVTILGAHGLTLDVQPDILPTILPTTTIPGIDNHQPGPP